MQAVAIATGLGLGVPAALFWNTVSRRSDARPLFAALVRSVRAMLADDGRFLREYGTLLLTVARFVLWNVLALAGALAPILLVSWLGWRYFESHWVWLVVSYSVSSLACIVWLRARGSSAATGAGDNAGGLSVSDSQYFLLQLVQSGPWLMRKGAAIETRLLRRRLDKIRIDRPVFITGLARSGTTMLLELLAQIDGVATHRYRDFPFLLTPYLWSRFVHLFGVKGDSVPRPHQDGIRITPESPEAFEEPIWQLYFPDVHRMGASHVLSADDRNTAFDEAFVDHVLKMLLIRRGMRYVSKGNYNVTRIEYIGRLFPDARFVVPVRHPVPHVASLVRQHELFVEYSRADRRVPHYLRAAGHFEFGPQRVPISVAGSAQRTLVAWEAGDEHRGYAIQWATVYGHVLDLLRQSPPLAERVMIVRYEDFCDSPIHQMHELLRHTGLEQESAALLGRLDHIKRSTRHPSGQETNESVWQETQEVASALGYEFTG